MLRLTAAATDTPFAQHTPDTDVAREAPDTRTLDEPLGLVPGSIGVVRVRTGKFTLNASVNTLRPADRLVVTFAGPRAAARPDTPNSRWPHYERRGWDLLFRAPILALSDPQAELDWNADVPRAGLYMGTFQDDLVPEVLALVDKVCDELRISRDRVVFYGACAGATAALLTGARRRAGTGIIAVNPPVRPEKLRTVMVTHGCLAAGGHQEDWKTMTRDEPWRNNALVALKDGLQERNDVRVFVAQNIKDRTTINRHFPGLWRRFDIDPDGGVSPDGRVCATLYDIEDADGSNHEPRTLSQALVRDAYAFFDGPLVVTPRKKRAGIAPSQAAEEADGVADGDDAQDK
jgi:hypothetical protein